MSTTIAIAGKGGTGKTTIAALLIKLLTRKGIVLAIDADPSSNLNMALGLPLWDTVGDIREEMAEAIKSRRFDAGMSKPDYIELKVNQALVESDRIDLLAMGRPEGPGCYCAANDWLRACMDRLASNYDYMVVDCEAGMEHISRQTTQDVDILILTSDPSIRGISAAARMKKLIGELRTNVGRICLVVNRINGNLSPQIEKAIADSELEVIAQIPADPQLTELDATGAPLVDLPLESPLQVAVAEIANRLGLL